MSRGSSTGQPNPSTCLLLQKLPLELRYLIFEQLLIDRAEQKLQHPLMLVCKQTQAEFADTIARMLGPKAGLDLRATNSSIRFALTYGYVSYGPNFISRKHHDIITGNFSSWHESWNDFRGSYAGREILSRTQRVRIWLPYLQWSYDITFRSDSAPEICSKNHGSCGDGRTSVTAEDAEDMIEATAEHWRQISTATSARWADAIIKDLRSGWRALREEARKEKLEIEAQEV